ncbi:MAG: hypothetical protein LBS45_10480 [Synergistaceae bacterium]|jgi:hypothetical protein|nr:hypothetical protein [Synergistaceae bacterium]
MHAYSTLFSEIQGPPKGQLVHELSMLLLAKRADGSESPKEIYTKYEELRGLFSAAMDE